MAKKAKKPAKKRKTNPDNSLAINGSFLDVINAAVKPKIPDEHEDTKRNDK